MGTIQMALNEENHHIVLAKILAEFGESNFNLIVEKRVLGGAEKKLKFCGRRVKGEAVKNGLQVSIPLIPGGSISWDLKVESVIVRYADNGDISVCRFFEHRTRSKMMTLTKNPI